MLDLVAIVLALAASAPEQGATRAQPAVLTGFRVVERARRLDVALTTGVCADGLRVTEVQQGRRAVRIRVDEVFGRGAPDICPEVAAERCVRLTLRRALGTRRVVDLARRRTVRRGLAIGSRPLRCERAREGGRLPPSRLDRAGG